jgi:RNA polymerase sigma-70 factor (ECF subfamily)
MLQLGYEHFHNCKLLYFPSITNGIFEILWSKTLLDTFPCSKGRLRVRSVNYDLPVAFNTGASRVSSTVVAQNNQLSQALVAGLDRAYLTALRFTRDPELAEEAVQEAYAALLRRQPKVLTEPQWIVYLCRAVRHSAIDLRRASTARQKHEGNYEMNAADHAQFADPPERLAANELSAAAQAALLRLPEDEREAVSLCCEQGLTWQQAADILEIPKRTLGNRLEKGLERLKSGLIASGFAAVIPVALGEVLQKTGIPPAPVGLSQTVMKLAVGKAAVSAGAAVGAKSISGVLIVAFSVAALSVAAIGGVWYAHASRLPTLVPAVTPPALPVSIVGSPRPILAHFDFEDGRLPPIAKGKLEQGPPREGNRFCLVAEIEDGHRRVKLGDNDTGIFTYHDGAVLTFDYWADEQSGAIDFYLWNRPQQTSMGQWTEYSPQKKKWARASIQLANLHSNDGRKMKDGDLVVDMEIQTGTPEGALYVDNVEVALPGKK